jgi:hypothetical protein
MDFVPFQYYAKAEALYALQLNLSAEEQFKSIQP